MEDHNGRTSSQSRDAQLTSDGDEVGDLAPGTSRRMRSRAPVIGVAGTPVVVVSIAGSGRGSSAVIGGQTVLPSRAGPQLPVRLRHRKLPGVSRAAGIRPEPRTVERRGQRRKAGHARHPGRTARSSYVIVRHAVLLGRAGSAPLYRLGDSSPLATSTTSYGMPCKPKAQRPL